MAIEIYDKAKIIKKDKKYYYFLKYGSKNCFTCAFQTVEDNNFHNRFIRRQARDSHWSVIAVGNEVAYMDKHIGFTYWNGSTGAVYGRIAFGKVKNIALSFAKMKAVDFDSLDDIQKGNIKAHLDYARTNPKYTIDLANIPDAKRFSTTDSYCGTDTLMSDSNRVWYKGMTYWNLDNC